MAKNKRSFFERLTGSIRMEPKEEKNQILEAQGKQGWVEEEEGDAQLTIDVFQTPTHIIIKTMTAGVRPEDLDISISRDMVTIKGKRESTKEVSEDDYFYKELYWGSFSRTVLLPQEIEVEEAEATERHGLLTISLPKVDKDRQTKLRVKTNS